jgi:hypothetical protein
MPLRGTHNPDNRRIDWMGIARTLALQVLALLALAGAFIVYLDWASDITFEEFVGISEPSTANRHPARHPRRRESRPRCRAVRKPERAAAVLGDEAVSRPYWEIVWTTLFRDRVLATGSLVSLTSISSYSGKV